MTEESPCEPKINKLFFYLFLSGIMKPGLNAIMGATGSGKSS